MKKLVLSVAASLSIIAASCGNDSHPQSLPGGFGSYELNAIGDTFNITDLEGKKQGIWIIKNAAGSKDTVYYKDGVTQ